MIDFQEKIRQEEEKRLENQIRKERRPMKKVAYFTIFLVISFFFFSNRLLVDGQSSDNWLNGLPVIRNLKHLVESADRNLAGENEDRINILLLGMGGKNHDGGYLTDTIILASLKPSTKEVALISIPRDMAIPSDNSDWTKINNINAYAENKQANSGGEAISQALGDILHMPINYYVRADFEGFTNIIDRIGGVTVDVENTLDDYTYPASGQEDNPNYYARYEHLHIDTGLQKMNGELALKYARSRHAYGVEGSDFARSKRQKKILTAVKDKLLDSSNLLKPVMIADVLQQMEEHVSTNLKTWEMIKLWSEYKDIDNNSVISKGLDDGPQGMLISSRSNNGAYILLPLSGDYDEVEYMIKNVFSSPSPEEKTEVVNEEATVEIINGTWINGLASRTATDLEKYGFIITNMSNAEQRDAKKSVIYDLSYGEKNKSLKLLKEKTNAIVSFDLPTWLTEKIKIEAETNKNLQKPDFIIVLGDPAGSNN